MFIIILVSGVFFMVKLINENKTIIPVSKNAKYVSDKIDSIKEICDNIMSFVGCDLFSDSITTAANSNVPEIDYIKYKLSDLEKELSVIDDEFLGLYQNHISNIEFADTIPDNFEI